MIRKAPVSRANDPRSLIATKPVYLTAEGLQKLERELEYLLTTRRLEVAEALHDTFSGGDSLDNTEYQVALYEQYLLETRIEELRNQLAAVQLIIPGGKGDVVQLGSRVVIEDERGQLERYLIVGPAEADPNRGKISDQCPLGRAILNHKAGDEVQAATPDGLRWFRISTIN